MGAGIMSLLKLRGCIYLIFFGKFCLQFYFLKLDFAIKKILEMRLDQDLLSSLYFIFFLYVCISIDYVTFPYRWSFYLTVLSTPVVLS